MEAKVKSDCHYSVKILVEVGDCEFCPECMLKIEH